MILSLPRSLSRLVSHSGFKKYFFNTGWLMLDKVLRMFLGLFVGVWVARYLGPENFGILNFAMSFVGLFGAFGKLGLDGIIVRNIVRDPDERDEILGTSLVLRFCGAIVLMLAVFGALQLTSATTYEKIIVMIIAFGQLFMSFEVFDFYFQSQVKAKFSGITGTFGLLASSLARISFILLGLPLIWFAGAVIIEQMTKSVFFLYFYSKQKLKIENLAFTINIAKKLLRDSIPLVPTGAVLLAYMKVDQIMLKILLNNEAVGIYAAAIRLIEPLYIFPLMLVNSTYPHLVEKHKTNISIYKKRLYQLFMIVYSYSLIIVIFYVFFSESIISIIYGNGYSMSANILSISAFNLIFITMRFVVGRWFLIENAIKYYFITSTLGLIINLILNYILIKQFGVIGASYATLISFLFATYILNILFSKTRDIFFMQSRTFFFKRSGK